MEIEPKTMSRLAIVRHGIDGPNGLNETGRYQIRRVGAKLHEGMIDGESALILSSTAKRAMDSAEILAQILGAPIQPHQLLFSNNRDHPENLEGAYQLIQSTRSSADLLVVVTHL